MLRSKPVVAGDRPLISIGYKYNARKVIYFIVTDNTGITKTFVAYLLNYPDQFTNVSIRPVTRPLAMSKKYAVNEVDLHNKSRQSDLALKKCWFTRCGWMRLCTTVFTGMTITNCWKLFRYRFKRDHYEKMTVSENSWNDLLRIASTILFHLIEGPQQRTYFSLMR